MVGETAWAICYSLRLNLSRDQSMVTIKYLQGIGAALEIKCLWDGFSWNNDFNVSRTKFKDGFH